MNRADPSARGDLVVVGCPFAQERLFEHYQVRVRARVRVRLRLRLRFRLRLRLRVRVSGRSP